MKAEESIHFAHSGAGRPLSEWHRLEQHLKDTAELAETFASAFAPGWGRIAGLWHDAGKYQETFQRRVGVDPEAHVAKRVDHSSVGALIAERCAPMLAFAIAGHHGGMPNAEDLRGRGLKLRIDRTLSPRRLVAPRAGLVD